MHKTKVLFSFAGNLAGVSVLALLFVLTAAAQNPVSWSLKAAPAEAQAGGKFNAQLSATIANGWHLYSVTQGSGGPIRTTVNVGGAAFGSGGAVSGPRPQTKFDPNFNINTETYSGSVTLNVPVTVKREATAGPANGEISVRYQACDETSCLPPRTEKIAFAVNVSAVAAFPTPTPKATPTPGLGAMPTPTPTPKSTPTPGTSPTPNASPTPGASVTPTPDAAAILNTDNGLPPVGTDGNTTAPLTANSANSASNGGMGEGGLNPQGSLWQFIAGAMLFGALSLLTPCVFPMIPITVSYFTNHAAGNRRNALRDATIYALGIILTFTVLGVLLAVIFGATGINQFAANPWINLIITTIFLLFALSLFGALNLQVPSSVLSRLDSLSGNRETGRIAGLLLMGLTFSLTSFTCTAPFVGTVLVAAAQGQLFYPIVGMLAFSTIFALPFFILALAPQLVAQLPRSGGWLNTVKVVMGLLEVAAALKFLSNADLVWGWDFFTREVVLAGWVGVAVLIGLYLLGNFRLLHDGAESRIGAARLISALVAFALAFYMLPGLFGKRLGELESFLPPMKEQPALTGAANGANSAGTNGALNTGTVDANGELTWITNDYEAALKLAKASNKPVFIDFTGYTCTNCRWMEANMFPRAAVRNEMARYVRVRLYTDREGEPYASYQTMQQQVYGTVALPYYVLLDSNGQRVATFPGLTRDENRFLGFLKQG